MKVFLALLFANICIATSSAGGDTYVYGPNTPVYYPEKVRDAVKVDVHRNKFSEKKAKYSGNSDAIFPKVLIITDNDYYLMQGESTLMERATTVIDGINSKFSSASPNHPVEVILAGLVIMKTSDVYQPSTLASVYDNNDYIHNNLLTQKYVIDAVVKGPREARYKTASRELQKISSWFTENEEQFGAMNPDIILYLSTYHLKDDTADIKTANLVMGVSTGLVCSSKPVVIVDDLIGDSHAAYAIALSYPLGVTHPNDKSDFPYYSSKFIIFKAKLKDWEKTFATVVAGNTRNNRYSCMKSSDYDDYSMIIF